MPAWNVAIVGGGPGGLMTAYALQKLAPCPVQITLFEASPRLGGKILTPQFRDHPVRYEAGAAEFYDYSMFDEDPLKDLIEELGLPIRKMGGPAVIMNHRILSNMDDIQNQLGPQAVQAVREFDRLAKDRMTPREFYYSDFPEGAPAPPEAHRFDALMADVGEPAARDYVETLIHSDLATEPARTSVAYGLQNYLMNDPAYMDLYGIEGGNERLPQELAARIAATIRLEQRVVRVSQAGAKLRVHSVRQGEEHQDDFDFVVIALPHAHLMSVEYQGDRLGEALRRHYEQYNFPAHYLRITILFEQPFWRDAFSDSYWMLDRFGGCCLYDESSRVPGSTHGVLGWLLAGEVAERMSPLSDAELIAEALDSLPHFLTHGRHDFIEGRVHRWVGAVNALPGGIEPHCHDRRHQPEPLEHPNLYLVGDYLFDSTLNGVLDSAEYVAAWIAAQLADTPRK
jgi:protoporphyrinogen oxidase